MTKIAFRAWLMALAATGVLLFASGGLAGNWPGWRGPTGQGVTDEKDLPIEWDAKSGKNILWKVLLHGGGKNHPEMCAPGWSCPIVWGDRVFLTTAVWPAGRSREEMKQEIAKHHVLCYRTSDGKQLWDVPVPEGKLVVNSMYHGYAVPTAVTDGKHVFALFCSGVVVCLDYDGKIVWREELPRLRDVDGGTCASPILYKDLVILSGIEPKGLRALEKKTGKLRWQQKTRGENRMSTPILLRVGDKEQLIHFAGGTQGVDPDTGDVLWTCRFGGSQSSPLYGAGIVYGDSGRGGRTAYAVDPTGKGDVSKTNLKWEANVTCAGGSSGVLLGEYVYRASNIGVRCLEAATGKEVYHERLAKISQAASPIATTDGKVYFACSGKSFVIEAGPKLKVLATNDLGDGHDFVAPAVSEGRLFIRGKSYLWCIGAK